MNSPNHRSGIALLHVLLAALFALALTYVVIDQIFPGALNRFRAPEIDQSGDFSRPPGYHNGMTALRQRFTRDQGRVYLSAGPAPEDRFDITDCRIQAVFLEHGLGREHFPALIEPLFIPSSRAELHDDEMVIAVNINNDVRVYPVSQLTKHELVNDVVGGRPIFIAYCVLAELGAVYDRTIGDHTFTFAVSGYTYSHDGVWDARLAFVLWDRDTQSLWWPPVGRAVSGSMIDTPLHVTDPALWSQTTWQQIRDQHPNARVLNELQDHHPPIYWPQYTPGDDQPRATAAEPTIAPRWGDNPDL